jgi:hypothetical protein
VRNTIHALLLRRSYASATRRAPALTYGVAVGAVEVDRGQYQNEAAPSWRAARWHMLALLTPDVGLTFQASLRERYGRKVSTDASLAVCEAVAGRLESSVSPAKMAELASTPSAVFKRI